MRPGAGFRRHLIGRIRRHAGRDRPARRRSRAPRAGEIICPDALAGRAASARSSKQRGAALTPLPPSRFDSAAASGGSRSISASRRSTASAPSRAARLPRSAALLDYVLLTQVGRAPALRRRAAKRRPTAMIIDQATRANLELTRTPRRRSAGQPASMPSTAPSRRPARDLLARRLASPLTDPDSDRRRGSIRLRFFVDGARPAREASASDLRQCPISSARLSRLSLGRGGPRDLAALRDGLAGGGSLLNARLSEPQGFAGALRRAGRRPQAVLADRPAALARRACCRAGRRTAASCARRRLRPGRLFARSSMTIAGCATRRARSSPRLQADYAGETGIKSLKIRHNNVLGYFIEVTAQNAAAAAGAAAQREILPPPDDRQRRALHDAGTRRTLEQRIAAAADRALAHRA